MAGCTCENWSLEDLSSALQDMHKDNKKIAVPMFQRGKRWNKEQQKIFIDSLLRGYPVGTLLFYETFEDGKPTYILVDGLQRGNCIKKYMNNPTEFFYDSSISDEFCSKVLHIVKADNENGDNFAAVRTILTTFIKSQKTFKNLQYFAPAKTIAEAFGAGYETIGDLIAIIGEFFNDRQALYDKIASTIIPVIVYKGDESTLPDIFDRINSKGTPLDQYEVYAAAWPVNQRFYVSNAEIVEHAIKKYDAFVEDGYQIHGYDRETMRTTKMVNAFEYLFGLGKYLVKKYDVLSFNTSLADDIVNPLGFELVNACLNDTDRIKSLYQNIYDLPDINAFELALYKTIDYVVGAISAITRFKGNSRTGSKVFHSKYQVLSMISTTFKTMYVVSKDGIQVSPLWDEKKPILAKNLMLYYVYDIITNYWGEGGTSKIHSAAKPNRYLVDISPRAWGIALDAFFEKSMLRTESKNIANPKSEEYVILNCIYLSTFTAMDQLSIEKFDVEHIAPKEQMKRLIATCQGAGLPISCIANLCYLPEYVNRSKKDRNFYQDTKYLQHINLEEVERKYSFTTSDDLEWMDMPYEFPHDFDALKQFYTDFCVSRFGIMKRLFCESMGIDYSAMTAPIEDSNPNPNVTLNTNQGAQPASSTGAFTAECISRVQAVIGQPLVRVKRNAYKSLDGKKGYVFTSSKAYKQGDREKYWFGYRKEATEDLQGCVECYMVFGCRNANEIIVIPISHMVSITARVNSSIEDGEISHWHIIIFRDHHGYMTQLYSKPELTEVEINQYKLGQ